MSDPPQSDAAFKPSAPDATPAPTIPPMVSNPSSYRPMAPDQPASKQAVLKAARRIVDKKVPKLGKGPS